MPTDDQMLAELRLAGVLFEADDDLDPPAAPAIAWMNCNDLFHWAYADLEPVTSEGLSVLYAAWQADPRNGDTLWACRQRKQRPQEAWERRMREHGEWSADFEALPPRKELTT